MQIYQSFLVLHYIKVFVFKIISLSDFAENLQKDSS